MEVLKIPLETVTPVFSGVEPRKDPEIRPPSIRGALRYWYRAALGGVIGDQEVARLSALESALFGAADEQSGASAVVLRLAAFKPSSAPQANTFSRLCGADGGQKPKYPGLAYLWFSARGSKEFAERTAWQGSFDLTLQIRPGVPESAQKLKEAYLALWLWLNLGALGSRARRGAGCLAVREVLTTPLAELPLQIQVETPSALRQELQKGLVQVRQFLQGVYSEGKIAVPSAFDVLHPQVCRIFVLNKTYSSWQQALHELGASYQRFRSRRDPDYRTVKESLTSGQALEKPVGRAAFGLPIQFYYRSLGGRGASLQSQHFERRASPLHFHLSPLKGGKYAVVLVWFRAQFLPQGEKLRLRGESKAALGPLPSEKLIETFLLGQDTVSHSSLKDRQLSLLEVNYA